MNGLLQRVQSKLQEARLSDINHELGKVKEQLIADSNTALNNIKKHFNGNTTTNKLPKSISLPVGLASHTAEDSGSSRSGGGRYCYKSSVRAGLGSEEIEEEEEEEEEKALDKFIKVIENNSNGSSSVGVSSRVGRSRRAVNTTSREEIRRKLAGLASHPQQQLPQSTDLQICFINEIVVDEDENGNDNEDSKDDDESSVDCSLRSATTPEALQSLVASKLASCEHWAKEQLAKEKRLQALKNTSNSASLNSPLKRVLDRIGGDHWHHDNETLQGLSTAALQLLLNHLHCRVEKLNCELVKLLELKDELLIEQDSQLLDLEDLTLVQQPRQRNASHS